MKPVYLEKKLALILRPGLSLLDQPEAFWRELTSVARVRILRQDRAPSVRAFLLAESSLLVWRDRLMLSTCGSGELKALVPWLRKQFGAAAVAASLYETPEWSTELSLRREVGGDTALLASWGECRKSVLVGFAPRDFPAALREMLPRGAEIFQEHDFNPVGYSCNACEGEAYLTLHFSPEAEGSCLSLESRGFEAVQNALLEAGEKLLSPQTIYRSGPLFKPCEDFVPAFEPAILSKVAR